MRIPGIILIICFLVCVLLAALPEFEQEEFSLKPLTPENYNYSEAAGCSNCKGEQNSFMPRAAGIDVSSGTPILDGRGWLASVHAVSQSHGDRINTTCAWCHAPTAEGATRDKKKAASIPEGTWQGVSCFSCHPGAVERNKRTSLVSSYTPGTDPADPKNYIFRDRTDGKEMNSHCAHCHHESHDLLVEAKKEMLASGELRCIDCHMAAYAVTNGHVERHHNMKVNANLPHSCSGTMGRAMTCHEGRTGDWFIQNIPRVKGPRKKWSSNS